MTKERTHDFDLFIERMKLQPVVYYDFDHRVLAIYEGHKDEKEMVADEVNWLEIDDRALDYMCEKMNLEAYEGIGLVMALAARGKNVVVKNFNPGNTAVWFDLDERISMLATDLGDNPGLVSFEPKSEDLLNPQEQNEKRFLEEFPNKPTIYYDVDHCQFFIYFGENIPLKEFTDRKDWATVADWEFQNVLGYSAMNYISHIIALLAMGYNLEVIKKEKIKLGEVLPEELEDFVANPPKNLKLAEKIGQVNYHYRAEDEDLNKYFLLK